MRIPDVQHRLRELASEHNIAELAKLADELGRRRSKARAPTHSVPIKFVRDKIIAAHRANPDLPYARIAAALNVNPGRVSETLNGFRR